MAVYVNIRQESAVKRVLVLLTILIAVVPPLLYFTYSLSSEKANMRSRAEISSFLITEHINKNPDYWRYERDRYVYILSHRSRKSHSKEQLQFFDNGKTLIAESVDELHPPLISVRADVYVADSAVGYTKITRSISLILLNTGLLLVMSSFCGMGLFFLMRVFPLKALGAALASLSSEKHQAAITLNSIDDAVITTDTSLRILSLNSAAEKFTGLDDTVVARHSFSRYISIIRDSNQPDEYFPYGAVWPQDVGWPAEDGGVFYSSNGWNGVSG